MSTVPAVPDTDPTLRAFYEAIRSNVFALRVKGDTFDHAGMTDGDIAVVRRQSHIDEDGCRYVVGDFEGDPLGIPTPITTVYFLHRLGDGLVEARDAEGHPRRVAPEALFDVQGRVLAVIKVV